MPKYNLKKLSHTKQSKSIQETSLAELRKILMSTKKFFSLSIFFNKLWAFVSVYIQVIQIIVF